MISGFATLSETLADTTAKKNSRGLYSWSANPQVTSGFTPTALPLLQRQTADEDEKPVPPIDFNEAGKKAAAAVVNQDTQSKQDSTQFTPLVPMRKYSFPASPGLLDSLDYRQIGAVALTQELASRTAGYEPSLVGKDVLQAILDEIGQQVTGKSRMSSAATSFATGFVGQSLLGKEGVIGGLKSGGLGAGVSLVIPGPASEKWQVKFSLTPDFNDPKNSTGAVGISINLDALTGSSPSREKLPIQRKLKVNTPGDKYEQEADRVAEQVMRMPEPQVQRQCSCGKSTAGGECPECKKKKKEASGTLQRVASAPVGGMAAPPIVHDVLSSGGAPLPTGDRTFMESRFGNDFTHVRVHTDKFAAESAAAVNARAYTAGSDIVFGRGESPSRDRHLLAHELTHVVQQTTERGERFRSLEDDSDRSGNVVATDSEKRIMKKGFESTIDICRRVLESRHFQVTQGGLRVVLMLNDLDKNIPNCQDFDFGVTLTRSEEWWPDDEIGTCEASTGGTRSFTFANLSAGTYYLTVWRNFDHPHCCLKGDIAVFDEPVSGDSSGCTRDKDPTALDIVHGALDIAGFVPVLGAIPDGINAAIYVVKGDWAMAGLSAVAMVPAWGDGVKLGAMAGKSAIKVSEKAAIKLGEEGIAKGLKEVKAASKGTSATDDVAKATKLEKEAAERFEKKAAEKTEGESAEKAASDTAGSAKPETQPATKETGSASARLGKERRKWLRARSPSDKLRAKYTHKKFDPLYKNVIADGLEADHIVPFDKIIQMPGFDKLTREQQLQILNYEKNFEGIAGVINASRGNRTFKEWDNAGGHFLHGRAENRKVLEELIQREEQLWIEIGEMIKGMSVQ